MLSDLCISVYDLRMRCVRLVYDVFVIVYNLCTLRVGVRMLRVGVVYELVFCVCFRMLFAHLCKVSVDDLSKIGVWLVYDLTTILNVSSSVCVCCVYVCVCKCVV